MLIQTEGPREEVIAAGRSRVAVVMPAKEDDVIPAL